MVGSFKSWCCEDYGSVKINIVKKMARRCRSTHFCGVVSVIEGMFYVFSTIYVLHKPMVL
jgi:hypothetical protein